MAPPAWQERYAHRSDECGLPKGKEACQADAVPVGEDGFALLNALQADEALVAVRQRALERAWHQHDDRATGGCRWREVAVLPPVAERRHSPDDPEVPFRDQRHLTGTGRIVHRPETCGEAAAHRLSVRTPAMPWCRT